jgi:YbbR domain-containing protein
MTRLRLRTTRGAARLRAAFTENLGLKLVSVVAAMLVWYATNVLERDAERMVEIPLVPRNVPPDLVVVDAPTTPIAVTLRGPRTLLEGVEDTRTRFVLPVRRLSVGTNRVELQAGRIEPELPRRLRVVRIHPGRVELRAEPLHRRRVPVRIELAGSPAFGYTIAESQVTPGEVDVVGPASAVDELRAVQTVPIDLRGLESNATRTVGLEWVGDFVAFDPDRVTVTARIEEVIVTRRFPKVAVQVTGPPGATLRPATTSLTLRGPERVLHNYQLPEDVASVDAEGLAPGTHRVEVVVHVPDSVEVVTRKPTAHRLEIPEGKTP